MEPGGIGSGGANPASAGRAGSTVLPAGPGRHQDYSVSGMLVAPAVMFWCDVPVPEKSALPE